MRKAKATTRSQEARKPKAARSKGSRKPVDLGAVRQRITNMVGNEAEVLVATTIEEANKGHYAAMKYLFEMVGLYPENGSGAAAEPDDDALAKTLLRRLTLPEEAAPEAQVTKETAEGEAKTGAAENHVE